MSSQGDLIRKIQEAALKLLFSAALVTALTVTSDVFAAPHLAQDTRLVIDPQPATIAPKGDGTSVTLLLVVKNQTTVDATNLRLQGFPDQGIKVVANQPKVDVLGADSEVIFELQISTPDGPVDGRVLLRVDYSTTTGGRGPTQRSAVVTVPVKTAANAPVAEIVDVSVKTTLDSLDELHPGRLYLIVSNKSDRSITLNTIEVQSPDFLTVAPPAKPVTLAPREVTALEMKVSATTVVQPGKHLLVFRVPGEWQRFGHKETWQTVSTHEVTVGVFGESEILKLLGVPSFFLVPGLLVLLTIGWFWKGHVLQPQQATVQFGLTPGTPEFWVAAITLSGAIAYAYRRFVGRNYLAAYGLQDIIQVWLLSIVIVGAGGYLAIALGIRMWHWYYAFDKDQDPIQALRRFHRHRLGLLFRRHTLTLNGNGSVVLAIEPAGDQMWVTSAVKWSWLLPASDPQRVALAAAREAATTPGQMAQVLALQRDSKAISVGWESGGLRQVPPAALTNAQPPPPIVEEA